MTPTDGRKAEKEFRQRQSGALPEDPAADKAYVAQLVILERDPKRRRDDEPEYLPARPLKSVERAIVLAGQQTELNGLVLLPEEAAERTAAWTAERRRRLSSKARKHRDESRRLDAEAELLDQ